MLSVVMDGQRSFTVNMSLSDTDEMDEDEDYDSDATNMSEDIVVAREGSIGLFLCMPIIFGVQYN